MEEGKHSRFTDVEIDMLDHVGDAGGVATKGWQKYLLALGAAIAASVLVFAASTKGSVFAAADMVRADSTALVEYSASNPDFHALLSENSPMVSLLAQTQVQQDSRVHGGTLYEWQTPGGKTETAIGLLLRSMVQRKTFQDLPDGCSLYWTLQIRIARKSKSSKWHSFAKSLKTGVQTIKKASPTKWSAQKVTSFGAASSVKVFVY